MYIYYICILKCISIYNIYTLPVVTQIPHPFILLFALKNNNKKVKKKNNIKTLTSSCPEATLLLTLDQPSD